MTSNIENNIIFKNVFSFISLVAWIAGVVIAEGGLKVCAILIPFYAWYLTVEKLMQYFKII